MNDNTITPQKRTAFLNYFVSAWNNWSYHEKPHCFWIREHSAEASSEGVPSLTWAQRVWVLDESGLSERNALDWRRFEILIANFGVYPFSGGVHEIGLGCFAPTEKFGEFYYEEIWGGRWGAGMTRLFNEDGRMIGGQVLWRS